MNDGAIYGIFSAASVFLTAVATIIIQGGTLLLTLLAYSAILLLFAAFTITRFVLSGYAHSEMAKKFGIKESGNAFIPVFQQGFQMHLIYKITGKKRLVIFDKYVISNGGIAFVLWVLLHYFGATAVQIATGELIFVPIVGAILMSLASLLTLVPMVAEGILAYAYTRDLLALLERDTKKINLWSIIVSVIDVLVGGGMARSILFMCYLKKKPLAPRREQPEEE